MNKLEEIEKRRAARREGHDKERAAQELEDLEAIDKLEEERGTPLQTMTCNGFQPGVPVKVAFRAPSALEYKKYCDQVGRAQHAGDPAARLKAQETLARVCLVYPLPDSDEDGGAKLRSAMFEAHPGLYVSLAIEAAKVAELRAEDEGKA